MSKKKKQINSEQIHVMAESAPYMYRSWRCMCRDMRTDECTDKLHHSCAWNTFKNLTPATKFSEVLWISITSRCERFTDWSDRSFATNFQPSKQHLVRDITLRSYLVTRCTTTRNTFLIQEHFMDVVDALSVMRARGISPPSSTLFGP